MGICKRQCRVPKSQGQAVLVGLAMFALLLSGIVLVPLTGCESQAKRSVFSEAKGNASDGSSLLSKILSNEIVFYGQVLDLDGHPVPGAKISYSSLNASNFDDVWTGGGPANKIMHTDENGCFEIHEVGGSLYVRCGHPDYYCVGDSSGKKFGYGFQVGDAPACDPQNPAIFRLRKKGIREPLYYSCGRMLNAGKTWTDVRQGECVVIDLARSRRAETATSVYISYKSDKQEGQRRGYNWECTLRIPGGGLLEKKGDFNFIAPESGYQEEIKIGYSADDPLWERASPYFYFVKFPNGLYGIFEIRVESGYNGKFVFQALINPNPSSRNLEYEYEKQINKNQGGDKYGYL